MVMASLKLHGSVYSTATMRAVVGLKEKELDFDFVPIDMGAGEHEKESFISLNPFGQVPVLEDRDLEVFDSRAITKYISHEYTSKMSELIYSDSQKMATLGVWMVVEADWFDPEVSKLAWATLAEPALPP